MVPHALQLSTEAFAAHERMSAWRELLGRRFLQLDIEPASPDDFHSSAVLRILPGFGIADLAGSPVSYVRSAGKGDTGNVALVIAAAEETHVDRNGASLTLAAGDAVVMTSSGYGTMALPRGGRTILLRLPHASLAPAVSDPGSLHFRHIPGTTPALRLLRRYLPGLTDDDAMADATVRQQATTHALDMITLALGATRDAAEIAQARGGRATRLRAIKDDIAKLLDREDFSIGMIALRQRVTPRYVQTLFDGEGTTFTEYVLGARLARAHRMLLSPHCTEQKISAIAYEAGFGDLSYFIRAFRRRYGALPSEIRAQARRHN